MASTTVPPAMPTWPSLPSGASEVSATVEESPNTVKIHELIPGALELFSVQIPAPARAPAGHGDGGDDDSATEKGPVTTTGGSSAAAAGTPSSVSTRKFLRAKDPARQFLPGQPRVRLHPTAAADGSWKGQNELLEYLRKAHLTKELDSLLPFMKYIFVQTPSHKHIMPLHHQEAHGRKIIVNEHPGLHLVWYYERIFVKPIPAYMYSQAFWLYLHDADTAAYAAAAGFMRSWYYLVSYDVDYQLACDLRLVPRKPLPYHDSSSSSSSSSSGSSSEEKLRPREPEYPTYEEFCTFMAPFRDLPDEAVNRRYRYGELRLTRINKTTMLFRGKLAYFHIHPQWGSYLSHIIAPIVTVFAVVSVILNALQVTLAAHEVGADSVPDNWVPFVNVSLYFPVAVMVLIAFIVGFALLGILIKGFKDLIWAKSVRHRRRKGNMGVGEKSYGLIW